MKKNSKRNSRDIGILLIAIFKLFKAALFLIVGIGVLSLLHKDVETALVNFFNVLHVDSDNHYIHALVAKFGLFSAHQLEAISAGSFFYMALLGTEGVGLLLRKQWAEYLTIIATASFIPLELYEIVQHVRAGRIIILIINIAMVVYLIYRVKYDPKHKQFHQAAAKARG